MELTKSELQIMNRFWESGAPLSRSDLLTGEEEKSWKDSSVHILLNGLLKKGAIREAGFIKCSKTYGRIFKPAMSREEYYAQSIMEHSHPPQVVALVKALLQHKAVTDEDREQIRLLLEK